MKGMFKDIAGNEACNIRFNIPEKLGEGITAYNDNSAAIAKGDVVMLVPGYLAGKELLAKTAVTRAIYTYTAVAIEAIADAKIGKFQISGECEAFVEGTTDVAAGNTLVVNNTNGNEFVYEAAAIANITTATAAVSRDAQAAAGNVLTTVVLTGERHLIS